MNQLEKEMCDILANRIYCMVKTHYEPEDTGMGTHMHWVIDEVSERMTIQEARDSKLEFHAVEGFCMAYHYKYIPKKEAGKRWELSHSYELNCNSYITPYIGDLLPF